jgi:hypothetical protein
LLGRVHGLNSVSATSKTGYLFKLPRPEVNRKWIVRSRGRAEQPWKTKLVAFANRPPPSMIANGGCFD